MSTTQNVVIKEYQKILAYKTWSKEVHWRTQVVRRKDQEGNPHLVVDIRKYVSSETKALMTSDAVYFDQNNLDKIIEILLEVRKEFFNGTGERT